MVCTFNLSIADCDATKVIERLSKYYKVLAKLTPDGTKYSLALENGDRVVIKQSKTSICLTGEFKGDLSVEQGVDVLREVIDRFKESEVSTCRAFV